MTQLNTWTATRIAWPNRVFDPSADESWVEPQIRYGVSTMGEIGETVGIGHRHGVLIIRLHTPKDGGLKVAADHAGNLETLFRRYTTLSLVFDEPNSDFIGIIEARAGQNFYLTVVTIPFQCFIGE